MFVVLTVFSIWLGWQAKIVRELSPSFGESMAVSRRSQLDMSKQTLAVGRIPQLQPCRFGEARDRKPYSETSDQMNGL